MIKSVLKDFEHIIIGIGSAQYSYTQENPFTSAERIEMINRALKSAKIERYSAIAIDDIHNDDLWVQHVESLVPRFHAVFTHDFLSKRLFSEKGYDVVDAKLLERNKYSGTEVRRRILEGEDWASLVPEDVAKCLKELGGEQRLREIHNK